MLLNHLIYWSVISSKNSYISLKNFLGEMNICLNGIQLLENRGPDHWFLRLYKLGWVKSWWKSKSQRPNEIILGKVLPSLSSKERRYNILLIYQCSRKSNSKPLTSITFHFHSISLPFIGGTSIDALKTWYCTVTQPLLLVSIIRPIL